MHVLARSKGTAHARPQTFPRPHGLEPRGPDSKSKTGKPLKRTAARARMKTGPLGGQQAHGVTEKSDFIVFQRGAVSRSHYSQVRSSAHLGAGHDLVPGHCRLDGVVIGTGRLNRRFQHLGEFVRQE